MKTAPTNKKVREIINLVKEGKIIPRAEFQRRLVWTHRDKDHFLDTILRGYPFPEIYLADGDVDLESGQGTQLLVDGLQRVSTMIEYFEGSPQLRLVTVTPYKDLGETDKRAFLQYDVAVRDLGSIRREEIIEVFRRINATKYSLLDIEINNAFYAGELKQFAEKVAACDFLIGNNVFNARDFKRMGDLRYALTLTCTLIQGYFNRDDAFAELLDRYNDEFPMAAEIDGRLQRCFDYISECGFRPDSRVWKKADLFTLVVELDSLWHSTGDSLQPIDCLERLESFFGRIEPTSIGLANLPSVYYKAAIQATNDKVNRLRRGIIVGGLLSGVPESDIMGILQQNGLV